MMIGLFTDFFRPKIDGVSITIERYVKELERRSIPYELFAPNMPGAPQDEARIHRFHSLPAFFQPELRLSIPLEPRILKYVVTHRYDILHSHTPGPVGMVADQVSRMRGIPHVHTFHGFFPDYSHYYFGDGQLSVSVVNMFAAWWANRVNFLIVPSLKVKTWLESISVTREIRVIPNGIDLSMFNRGSEQKSRYLMRRGIVRSEDFVLLFVGRIAKEKSVKRLIDAFAPLTVVHPNIKLVLVGDGPDKPELEEYVVAAGLGARVAFTGYVNSVDMPEVYRAADVFTFLSTSETQGMVVLEAMASGLPVIVQHDAAYEDTVFHGVNGFAIEDAEGFRAAVETLYTNPEVYEQQALEGQSIARRFDIEQTITRTLNYYDHITAVWRSQQVYD
jgi:1,2-diacylglycerol 3-alpha-glucosyltransferase